MKRNPAIPFVLISFGLSFIVASCTTAATQPTQNPETTKVPSMMSPVIATDSSTPVSTPLLSTSTQIIPVSTEPTHSPIAPTSAAAHIVGHYCTARNVHLDIPDRDEDENAPEEGWCGETSIQMALGYYGKQVSQQAINLAGKPKQPDLWEDDINVALDALGVKYAAWDENDWDVDGFLTWITTQLEAGYPVLLGVKIYPDENPDWEVDHFVLVVGCDKDSLIINTNNAGEGQVHATYDELTNNFVDSYSIINRQKYLFGRSIQGLR